MSTPMALTAGQKTNVTAVETALTTAIASLSNGDAAQFGVRSVLMKLRQDLEQIRNERNQ